jgi:general secretion pathway protein J
MISRFRRPLGFTLIEVLVAIALMALISTILISSLHIGGHTWQRVTRQTEGTQDVAQAQAFLRERLSSIYPYERAADPIASPAFLLSDGKTIEFSGFAPQSIADGVLRFQIDASTINSGTLEVRYLRDRTGSAVSQSSEWSHEALLAHVAALSVQFWQKLRDQPGQWVNHWDDPTQLPRLIRIDVSFPANDQRRWPPLYIEPRVDTAANCQFDVVSRRCRRAV